MSQTVVKQTDPSEGKSAPGKYKRKRSQELITRDIRAYELHMNGSSIRAIGDDIGVKSSRTAWEAVRRGEKHVEENGINITRRTIEIDQLFKNTLGHLAGEISRQAGEGRIQTIERSDGSREIRRTKGIDPRTAEALARSADQWAQFLGITDRANETTQQATVINLSAPADGASFSDRWSSAETVDVTTSESKSESTDLLMPADASADLHRPTPSGGVKGTSGHPAVGTPALEQQELI
ncbi:hypothetical protein [Synechococcus sp. UW105]|uniref:hypothetical protein n=1 Tax=Synechococcus sp. UW105 TaxID=337067 RepID=UPI0010BDD419|nr:hypothetical protein [Synechococcus sp. UW105]